jgi:hypothetical protein
MKSFKKFLSVQEAKAGYCSDECCGSDVKAEDCPCPPTCPHCDCNAEVNETFDPKHPKVVAARKAHKAGTYDGNVDKNGNAIVHINGKPHTVTKGDPAAKTESVDEGSIKGSGTDRKSVLKKAYRSGEQDTRQFNTPGGAATNKPKRGSDSTVKKAYQAGRDSEHGDSAYKGKRRSKPQDTLGYKKPGYNEAIEEGILDNIKKKANDIRRKVVGPNQAEKDAAKKKQMAKQRASTMKNIGSAMSAVAKKDKAAEVARLKQGLKNVENQRKESVELDEKEYNPYAKSTKKAVQQANANKAIAKARNSAVKTGREVDNKREYDRKQAAKATALADRNKAKSDAIRNEAALDEISPELQKSYSDKARKQYKQSANKKDVGGGDYGSAKQSTRDKHQKRFDKRHKGIGSIIKRSSDQDLPYKDPKGLVRKDPKSNTMTGKPAPYKNKNEAFNLDEDIVNRLTAEYINENAITLDQLENMSEQELNELIGKAIGGAFKMGAKAVVGGAKLAKKAVVNKQGNIRGTQAAKQDNAGNKAEKEAKKKEGEFKRKKRIQDMKKRASDLDKKISDMSSNQN